MKKPLRFAKLSEGVSNSEWFGLIILIVLFTDLTIFFNIPFLRQLFGFLFLTILPGLLILKILKINKISSIEKFVLSVGLSISFLMLFGLLINNLSLGLGYETPLLTAPLLLSFNLAFIVLAAIGYKVNKESFFSLPNLNLSTSEKAFLIIPILFPALSIFGMHVMNTTDNNTILMFLLFLIPTYVAFVCFFNQKFSKRLYPVVIFLISISLSLLYSLRSNHIIGADTHSEYYYFQIALDNLHWSALGKSLLDACLSISLLPMIYQSILDVDAEFLFKILYSLLFSISPLAIYVLSKRYIEKLYAFLASFSFMSLYNFLLTPVHARTNTAILFFTLAMMVLFSAKIDLLKKKNLLIIFIASGIVSHYSTSYIFFFIMLGTFIGLEMLSKKYTFKKVISLTFILLFFAFIFFWYSQVTNVAFNYGVRFIGNTFSSLNEFFVEEMRSGTAQSVFGGGSIQKGIPYMIEFVFTWLIFTFIGIGIITLIRRYKEMSFSELNFKKADFLMEKFEVGYFVFALVCSGLLVAVVALPYVSKGYSIDRVYLLVMGVLSVFFGIGGIIVAKYLNKLLAVLKGKESTKKAPQVRAYLIILLVLIPYFFCTTGVTYQAFGVPRAIILNSEGEQYMSLCTHDQEGYSAKWLGRYGEGNLKIYTDRYGFTRVANYDSKVRRSLVNSHLLTKNRTCNGYIYLRYPNIVNGKLLISGGKAIYQDISEYSHQFVGKSTIYGNGGSEIWK